MFKKFLANLKHEFRRIKWPSRGETGKSLVLCIIGVAALCVLTMAADAVGLALIGFIL